MPGASSNSTWPSASIAVKVSRMTCSLPSTACPTLATSFSKVPANHSACSVVIVMGGPFLFLVQVVWSGGTGSPASGRWFSGGLAVASRSGGLQPRWRYRTDQLPAAMPEVRWYQMPPGCLDVLYQIGNGPSRRPRPATCPQPSHATDCRRHSCRSPCGVLGAAADRCAVMFHEVGGGGAGSAPLTWTLLADPARCRRHCHGPDTRSCAVWLQPPASRS